MLLKHLFTEKLLWDVYICDSVVGNVRDYLYNSAWLIICTFTSDVLNTKSPFVTSPLPGML